MPVVASNRAPESTASAMKAAPPEAWTSAEQPNVVIASRPCSPVKRGDQAGWAIGYVHDSFTVPDAVCCQSRQIRAEYRHHGACWFCGCRPVGGQRYGA